MTDLTIIGRLTGNDSEGLEITEDSGKKHWVVARPSLCKELEQVEWNKYVKVRGYINGNDELVASKISVMLGEDERYEKD